MSVVYEEQSTQTIRDDENAVAERIKKVSDVYQKRKDILKLKSKLLSLVDSPEYWPTLAKFLHGECTKNKFDTTMNLCLKTNEARLLHNEFIRALIFNAHFSMKPPPNVVPPKAKYPNRPAPATRTPISNKRIPNFISFFAADLGRLLSIEQMYNRVANMKCTKDLTIDENALFALILELRHYLIRLLQTCIKLAPNDRSDVTILTSSLIGFVLRDNPKFGSIVSPSILSKFPSQ